MITSEILAHTYEGPVKPEWIDYNGHMSEAFYVLVFGYETDTGRTQPFPSGIRDNIESMLNQHIDIAIPELVLRRVGQR